MPSHKFIWNKVLDKNIGAMAEKAGEALDLYDPNQPLKINWEALQNEEKKVLLGGAYADIMSKQGVLSYLEPAIEVAPMFDPKEIEALKELAKNCSSDANGDTAVLSQLKAAFYAMFKLGVCVTDCNVSFHTKEMPTVSIDFGVWPEKKGHKTAYALANMVVEAIHTYTEKDKL